MEPERSRAARAAAESALVRVVHHYGARPEFVVLGGLVPELLCTHGEMQHAGTTDVDVQVNLEIANGAVNTRRLELALLSAEFEADSERIWRWKSDDGGALVKFELLADLDDQPAGVTVQFDECNQLGAANLRGTRFATQDIDIHLISSRVNGVEHKVEVNISGLAGFLLAKTAAAKERRSQKDWYDLAFVLLHNDAGGPEGAARRVLDVFAGDLRSMEVALDDLCANFADPSAQGPSAYVDQLAVDHPEIDEATARADSVVAVETFHGLVMGSVTD